MLSPACRRPRPRLLSAVALLVSLALVTACSSAVDQIAEGAGKPQEGGVIRVGALQDIVPASIFTNSSDAANTLVGAVYDSLVDYPLDTVRPKPALATAWKFNGKGTELTLQLRDDVTFHDGRAFTSKDVEFSIKTWANPQWSVQLQRTAAAITGFDTSDKHAITLTFDHPVSNAFDLLDMLPIIDSASIDDVRAGKAFVGTGPFVFESWEPGSKLTFTRNDDYWDGKPLLEGVEIAIIPDPQAQVAQLRSGQLDVIHGATHRDIESLDGDDRFRLDTWDGAEVQEYVGVNVEHEALSDVRLRKAVAFALDRDRIVKDVFRGTGNAANLPWPEYSPAYDPGPNSTYDYDLDRASKLVKEYVADKGAVPVIPLTYTAGAPDYDAIAQIAQADLGEIGIKVELDPLERPEMVQRLIGAEFDGLWILQHSYAQYNPATLTVSAYPFNAEHNASRFRDASYSKHADAAWKQKPGAPTAEDYAAISRDLLEGAFLLELVVHPAQTVARAQVGDVGYSKRKELDFADAYLGG